MSREMLFTVRYRDERCKKDALSVLNAIHGVSAKNDQHSGKLLRNVTVTVTGSADPQIPLRILKIFGPVHQELVFDFRFNSFKDKSGVLAVVNALKGVEKVAFDNGLATLRVFGDAKPKIVLNILQKYGTARLR